MTINDNSTESDAEVISTGSSKDGFVEIKLMTRGFYIGDAVYIEYGFSEDGSLRYHSHILPEV